VCKAQVGVDSCQFIEAASAHLAKKREFRQQAALEADRHRRRVAYFHVGLFARKAPPKELGSPACDSYWKSAENTHGLEHALQEREDLEYSCSPAQHQQLRAHRPNSASSESASDLSHPGQVQKKDPQASVGEASRALLAIRDAQKVTTMMCDLYEGFRVAILGKQPEPLKSEKVWPPLGAPTSGSKEEALRVYKTYCDLIGSEAQRVAANASSSEDELSKSHPSSALGCSPSSTSSSNVTPSQQAPSSQRKWKGRADRTNSKQQLPPMSWASIYEFVEERVTFSGDARRKSIMGALLRALKAWHGRRASEEMRRSGVPIVQLFRWMWPSMNNTGASKMLSHMCLLEVQKLRCTTPPVISDEERCMLRSIFQDMDVQRRGYCTPVDIAGGEVQDIKTMNRNTLNVGDAKKMLGETARFDLRQFLELMCSNGFRGHEDASRMVCEDGRILTLHTQPGAGFKGWVHQHPSEPDKKIWDRVAALEAEILKLREVGDTLAIL